MGNEASRGDSYRPATVMRDKGSLIVEIAGITADSNAVCSLWLRAKLSERLATITDQLAAGCMN